ncbi:hypothetical protein [Bifidobacterium longum]|uniref:Uncharacterized protein n=1 Tax=Bifidobacterium longum subsp. longum TaxID=1679 RepID=A0A9Q8QSK2_BIFLL|nr:hypothetical protein [Bifidobacterium longum]UNL65252.1 hypothetical protein G8B15_04580 [Bifidobacterium longum subsp. longum]UNL67230.1 hypothetical protein G8B14_04380 [Bifidobacterium longum subsp. longum]UNL69063.1 hypothetical protein G8B13_03370 [Bifidobacterium longum subsp. longum]UNL70567.1 hypothetical protein G8B12_00515 [Bifidobacterium longum subsp. longum]UNL81581.1 hypothetical protein G8B11_04135 [Bifidobacterium longum subsp. longum]
MARYSREQRRRAVELYEPETVVPVDVTDGSAGNGWKTASVDLSQYAGKKIATLGLIVKAGAD